MKGLPTHTLGAAGAGRAPGRRRGNWLIWLSQVPPLPPAGLMQMGASVFLICELGTLVIAEITALRVWTQIPVPPPWGSLVMRQAGLEWRDFTCGHRGAGGATRGRTSQGAAWDSIEPHPRALSPVLGSQCPPSPLHAPQGSALVGSVQCWPLVLDWVHPCTEQAASTQSGFTIAR